MKVGDKVKIIKDENVQQGLTDNYIGIEGFISKIYHDTLLVDFNVPVGSVSAMVVWKSEIELL